ncbi:ArsR/SmtB family transcription factor [Vibrio neptunius]|uniref:ArsR/SmtB family transcription factor n=1 Tax=Vibrio neptunius TaxID=170651 RepID=UPI0019D022D5|nr:winged helix-turn-helix domain-containing protein [Vibrio neptunius]MBN3574339.1 winged helix-turn-helix transcriptional regulator [Vibrio neptunius]QXX08913.1 winged helix-turn-helix domain-containing protein [Vibrio neptunius]
MANQCNLANQQAFSTTDAEIAVETAFALKAKALSHPARVRILKILVTLDNLGGCLNSDLVSQLGLAQSTVSEHLRILKQAEFIIAEPNPPKVCYKVNREAISEFSHAFNTIFN